MQRTFFAAEPDVEQRAGDRHQDHEPDTLVTMTSAENDRGAHKTNSNRQLARKTKTLTRILLFGISGALARILFLVMNPHRSALEFWLWLIANCYLLIAF